MDSFSGYDNYIERLNRIRALSSPSLDGIDNADAYSIQLRENFVQIGHLAEENRTLLNEQLFPLLKKDKKLTEDEIREISAFEEKLLDAENAENLDLPIAFILSEQLMDSAMSKEEMLPKLRHMDKQISACYTMMNMTFRLNEYPEIAGYYRKKGMDIGQLFLELRKKENFRKVESEEGRELILTNARFVAAFYENVSGDRAENVKNLELLRDSLAIYDDPFYTGLMPDFDWNYYRYRLLCYFALTTDHSNFRGFTEDDFQEIYERTEELWELWHSDPDYFSELEKESYVSLLRLRNRYYAKKITREAYMQGLLELYHVRDNDVYDICGIVENVQIPVELLGLSKKDRFTEADKGLITFLFNNVIAYIFHMPNSGTLTFMLEASMHVLNYFIELPGEMDLEGLVMNLLAALHPPTYVHSRMVARFSVCLCGHIIDLMPELLIGIEGCESTEAVRENRDALLDFIWHAAICHDAGKISIIDTIFVYGRNLLDMEFDLVKTHPKMGAAMLRRFSSSEKYAEIALGHHKWYDNSRGYPEDFDTRNSPLKTVIDLVQCADCLDAATDTIGRSYNRGKTFDEFCEEIRGGSGTRYAPWLYPLLSKAEVREDIEFLLTKGRDRIYHDTYQLLKAVNEKED
jgi:HD-GYP domain-containing protein (c-di-GMP phosphodiesterase class II)